MFGFDAVKHERRQAWYARAARLLVCVGVCALALRLLGPLGLFMALPVFAVVYARSLLELPGALRRRMRARAWRSVSGRFYEFKGLSMRVVDDEVEHMRWLLVDDLAKALGEKLKIGALKLGHAQGLRELPEGGLYISDEAALAYLAGRQTERSARLRVWVEQEVWYPARHRHAGRL